MFLLTAQFWDISVCAASRFLKTLKFRSVFPNCSLLTFLLTAQFWDISVRAASRFLKTLKFRSVCRNCSLLTFSKNPKVPLCFSYLFSPHVFADGPVLGVYLSMHKVSIFFSYLSSSYVFADGPILGYNVTTALYGDISVRAASRFC